MWEGTAQQRESEVTQVGNQVTENSAELRKKELVRCRKLMGSVSEWVEWERWQRPEVDARQVAQGLQ